MKATRTNMAPPPRSRRLATRKRPKLTRAQKAEQIKTALFDSAAKAVGEHGYMDASILEITRKANVANGTFYNYFETRQDLFDELLPSLGREMLSYIGERSHGADELEREGKRLTAFFEFMTQRPEFYRILYEAEVFAPAAFDAHMSLVKRRYLSLLQRALKAGEIKGFREQELEVIVLILMGARHYMAMRYGPQTGDGEKGLPNWVVETYMKFIAGGLRALRKE